MREKVNGGGAQVSPMRRKLKIVESQAGEELVDGGDIGGGVEDTGVVNANVTMGETVCDMVHETLEGSRGARSSHRM